MNINIKEVRCIKNLKLNIEFESQDEIYIFTSILDVAFSRLNTIEHIHDFERHKAIIKLITEKLDNI